MIRRVCLILFTIAMFMAPLAGTAEEENLVELDSEQRAWLEYRCSLPDGGLIVTGGMRLYGAGKETGSYVLCLNADRTVRWEYTDREKNGYTSAEEATVLSDGTVAVVVWDYPRKIAVKFFTPQGKRTGKKLDLTKKCGENGQISDITPSFIMKTEYLGNVTVPGDFRYETTLYNWKGKEITRYDGDVVFGGYGFSVKGSEGLTAYGQDTVYNSHAKATRIDWLQGSVLWETVLDYQQPETDMAVLDELVQTEDGGYAGWLRERKPAADDSYEYTSYLVRFDAEGRLLWIRDTESLYPGGLLTNLFSCGGYLAMQCENGENDSWSKGEPIRFLWTDPDGNRLGTTELTLKPEDFRLTRDRQDPEEKGVYRYPVLGIDRMIRMEDGLWAFATLYTAEKRDDDDAVVVPPDDREFVLVRIPEYQQP